MKSSEHDLELTRRYLDGDATPEEVAELEKRMLADPQLREDFLRYVRILSLIHISEPTRPY